MRSDARSAITRTCTRGLQDEMVGMTEASAIRNPSTPITLKYIKIKLRSGKKTLVLAN